MRERRPSPENRKPPLVVGSGPPDLRPLPSGGRMTWRGPLADVVIAEDDLEAVVETYRSGWLSMGPRTEELEAALAAYTGARHALAVSSCTVGLHLMCAAVGLQEGDEVIVPSLTFVASANAVRYTGATPVFAEIEGLDAPWLSAEAA